MHARERSDRPASLGACLKECWHERGPTDRHVHDICASTRRELLLNQVADKITFPPVVYVPCSPLTPGDEELSVDLRQTREGKLALLAYSALDRLVTCCGEQQPWVVLPTANLEKIREKTEFELILLDIDIPDEFRRHGAEANS